VAVDLQDEGEGSSRQKLNQKIRECVRYLKYGVLANRNEWNKERGKRWYKRVSANNRS